MQKKIDYYDWSNSITESDEIMARVGNDLVIVNGYNGDSELDKLLGEPFKVDMTIGLIFKEGEASICINMKRYRIKAPCMVLIFAGQIIQRVAEPGDALPISMSMSKDFTNDLRVKSPDIGQYWDSAMKNPIIPLAPEDMDVIDMCITMICRQAATANEPYRTKALQHLLLAFFWGYTHTLHQPAANSKTTRQEQLTSDFVELLSEKYKSERSVSYYASELCVTPKYLSTVVKTVTGKTVNEWIDDYVITECKALLLSTPKTVEEVGYEMNFDSLSLFSKFFGRVAGLSPTAYRKKFLYSKR